MSDHDYRDDTAAYALGALGADERASFEAQLADDAEGRAAVDSYRRVAALLALAVAPATPNDAMALRNRIVSDAALITPLTAARRIRANAPSAVAPAAARRGAVITRLPWLAAAASLAVAVASGSAYVNSRSDNRHLASALERVTREAASERDVLAARDSVLQAFMGPMVHVVSLSPSAAEKPTARVFWNHTKKVFIVTAFSIPQAPAGKTYQLWAIMKGKAPISMGTFNTDPSGRALAIVPVGSIADAGFVDNCAMTLEPLGGSPQPTETPRLLGSWRHVD